ncbi:MAG: hypothetical protein ABMA00_01105 [Gemmatimonas sp.]
MTSRLRLKTFAPCHLPLLALLACGGDTRESKAAAAADGAAKKTASCNRGDTTAVYVAFREYIKTSVPTPQRFLTAAGTDSAAPEDGFRAMQDKGPSYFYGGDSIAQRKIREKLASVGPYASLLIVHRGTTIVTTGDTVTVRLGGHFIGGALEGKTATSKTIVVVCATDAWKVASAADAPAS